MNCKFCGAELEPEVLVCPACGKENAHQEEQMPAEEMAAPEVPEETEAQPIADAYADMAQQPAQAPKVQSWRIVVASVAGLVLGVVLMVAVMLGTGIEIKSPFRANDIYRKDSYTITANLDKHMDKVVATMGDAQLTNGELQVYYWMQFYDFVQYYGSYLANAGMDYTQPLDTQYVSGAEKETTWEQSLLDAALNTWQRYQALEFAAKDAGYTYDAGLETFLTNINTTLEENAEKYGYASPLEMIQADMGPGATVEGYIGYMDTYNRGVEYFNYLYESRNPSEDEITAYFNEHGAEIEEEYGVSKNTGKLVDVRHILLTPEGGTLEGTTTVYTDAEWAACLTKAEDMLQQWKSGEATEDSFAQLANQHSTDGGSNSNGGLYTNVALGDMVEEFEAWCFDEARQAGDTGLVKTVHGYHIMYYVDGEEGWVRAARDALLQEYADKIMEDAMEKYSAKITYNKIVLGRPDFDVTSGDNTTETTTEQ